MPDLILPRPLLSIVIANYNSGRFLSKAVDSILHQCDDPVWSDGHVALPIKGCGQCVELIICDAKSIDNSLNVIQQYASYISWWCSEKDGGQSAAFNKGFSHARGEWLTWLNADELYVPGTLAAFAQHVSKHQDAEWVSANDFSFDDRTCRIQHICWGPHMTPLFPHPAKAPSLVFGPTSFFSRRAFDAVGGFDEDIHYGMDTAYWRRMTLAGYRQSRMNRFCWMFRIHQESKTSGIQTPEVAMRRAYENQMLVKRYGAFPSVSWTNPWYLFWMTWRIVDGSLIRKILHVFFMRRRDWRKLYGGGVCR